MNATEPHDNTATLWLAHWPRPGWEAHKYQRGSVFVWSGPPLATGASRLAATASLRAGAGLVTLVGSHEALMVHAAHVTAVMLREMDGAEALRAALADKRVTAIILGPGMGVGVKTCDIVLAAIATCKAVVIDADGLTSFAGQASRLGDAIGDSGAAVVMTPHEGEFARLTAGLVDPAASRHERAMAAAALFGATMVLKGAETIIASPCRDPVVNRNAPTWLATAGSGDVLAGVIGGLAGQGMPAFEAACAAVWLHGRAGHIAGRGLIAEDLVLAVSKAVGEVD